MGKIRKKVEIMARIMHRFSDSQEKIIHIVNQPTEPIIVRTQTVN